MPVDIPQISFGGGIISPATFARVDLQKFGTAVAGADNFFVHAEGGISNRAGLQFIKETKDSSKISRNVKFEFNEEQAYNLEFGDLYMRPYQNGGAILESTTTITGATAANPVAISDTAHPYANGEQIYITSIVGMTELNGKYYIITNKTANTYELAGVDGTAYTAYVSGGTAARVFTLTTPYLSSELALLKFRQSNDVMYLTHRNHRPRKLTRTGAAAWTLTVITFAPTQAAPTSVTVTPQGTPGTKTWQYRVTAISSDTAEESVVVSASTTTGADPLSSTNFNRIAFTAASGAGSYKVYKEDNGLYGLIGSTETTTFDDTNIAADLTDGAPKLRNPFSGAGNYPGAVGLHEQRSVWGNSTNDPLKVWLSQTSQFENMNISSPTRAADAVTMRLVTGKGNEIRHFRSFQDMLFTFTSGAAWTIKPGGNLDAITQDSKKVGVEEYLPSTDVPPLTIKKNILMVAGKQSAGFEVNSIGYKFETDAYSGSDLTVLARSLFENYTITEWAYAERPFRLVATVRSDGKLLVLTYLQEHQIFAWTLWEAANGGKFESVASVPEGQEDKFYFIVNRTVNGLTVRYQEQLHARYFTTIKDAFFVDSGLTLDITNPISITGATTANPVVITSAAHPYSNGDIIELTGILGTTELNYNQYTVANKTANSYELAGVDGAAYTAYISGGSSQLKTKTITNLDHLESETVIALADGNLETGLVVTNGEATLTNASSIVHAGLDYAGLINSLPLNLAPTTMSRGKIAKQVTLRVKDTRGLFVGPDENNLEEYPSRSTELWGDPAATLTDLIKIPISDDWQRESGIAIKSEPGLPMTILYMAADIDIGS